MAGRDAWSSLVLVSVTLAGCARSPVGRQAKPSPQPEAALSEEAAVRFLMRQCRRQIDGTEPAPSWPDRIRREGSAFIVDIDTSLHPGGYPERIVVDVRAIGPEE